MAVQCVAVITNCMPVKTKPEQCEHRLTQH